MMRMITAEEARKLEKGEFTGADLKTRILYYLEGRIKRAVRFHSQDSLLVTFHYRKNDRFSSLENAGWLASEVTRKTIVEELQNLGYKTKIIQDDDTIDLLIDWGE